MLVKQEILDLFPNERFVIRKDADGIDSFLKILEDMYCKSIEKVHCGPVIRFR